MHFTHVRTTGVVQGQEVTVTIGRNVTPELAELLVLMRNNLPTILHWAHEGLTSLVAAAASGTTVPPGSGAVITTTTPSSGMSLTPPEENT